MTTRTGAFACALLLLVFAALSFSAVRTKSPTVDEPVQTVAGWLRLHRGDYRLDIEDPPLWELWASLPNGPDALRPDFSAPSWSTLRDRPDLSAFFATHSLFNTPGIDGDAVINQERAMMLVFGVLLGALIALWSWQIAGPVAAVAATFLYALDPTFLGHAPLVKNDVASALTFLAAAWAAWQLGRRLTVSHIVLLAVVCGAAVAIKFSAVLLAPIVALLLAVRCLSREPWGARWLSAIGIGVVVAAFAWLLIWASYGFRFAATPDGPLNGTWIIDHLKHHALAAARGSFAAVRPEDLAAWQPGLLARAVLWARDHHLLPEAWLDGFLYTYSTTLARESFLLGKTSDVGFWYYFPVAILVKTPLATLFAMACTITVGVLVIRSANRWTLACLVIPPAVYFASSLQTHMNIGLRHVLPIYPFVFIGCGIAAAEAIKRWARPARLLAVGIALGLAAETLLAAPNFIAFFNATAGGSTGGLRLLADSNLDWGQDLKQLAAWQRSHPNVNLYLSYFGLADPAFYGIRFHALPGNYAFGPQPVREQIQPPAVFAISASHLQGISMGVDVGDMYAPFRSRAPIAILGGTLYLYDMSQ